jgi:hypothetical protein
VPLQVSPPNDPEPIVTDPTPDSVGDPTSTQSTADDNDTPPATKDDVSLGSVITKFLGNTTSFSVKNAFGHTTDLGERLDTKGEVDFFFRPPLDQTIDTFELQHFDKSTKAIITVFRQNIPRDGQPMRMFITGINNNSYLRPKFKNSSNQSDYSDGSVADSVSYVDLEGKTRTGTNLEAHLNNDIQAFDFTTGGGRQTVSHQLG